MPRSKRRSAADMGPDDEERHCSSKRQRNTSSTRRFSKSEDSSSFSQKRCIAWFGEYTSPDDPELLAFGDAVTAVLSWPACQSRNVECLNGLAVLGSHLRSPVRSCRYGHHHWTKGPEGMEKFCEDIGVEPENVVMLVLAWKMNARQMGFFTLQEWLRGLTELQCDTVQKVKNKLDLLRSILNDQTFFKSIYRYAYDFARDKDQRSMDMETAKAMLQLLLGKHWSLFAQFSNFLEHSKYKVINKDQWCNILEFSRTIVNDLSNYDVDGAWPVMLDEFVEWLKVSKNNENRRS